MKVMCQSSDKLASKYCFKASCKLIDPVARRTIGKFVAYYKTPDVAKDVLTACEVSLDGFPRGSRCDPDVDLVFLQECPVECVREVRFYPEVSENEE